MFRAKRPIRKYDLKMPKHSQKCHIDSEWHISVRLLSKNIWAFDFPSFRNCDSNSPSSWSWNNLARTFPLDSLWNSQWRSSSLWPLPISSHNTPKTLKLLGWDLIKFTILTESSSMFARYGLQNNKSFTTPLVSKFTKANR